MKRLSGILLATFFLALSTTVQITAQTPPPGEHARGGRAFGGDFKGTAGEITEIKGDTLVLKTEQGTQTVKTTERTMFRREGGAAKLANFKVGDRVVVGGEPGPDNTWAASFVGTPRQGGMMGGEFSPEQMGKKFIMGEVLKIDGTKITLKRPDGVEQTIEVDEDTSFRKSRTESVTLADIKVGDRVGGRGEVKNGVFVPSVLNVGLRGMGGGDSAGRGMMHGTHQPPADATPAPKQDSATPKEDKQ